MSDILSSTWFAICWLGFFVVGIVVFAAWAFDRGKPNRRDRGGPGRG
jgi:hypothetical protein